MELLPPSLAKLRVIRLELSGCYFNLLQHQSWKRMKTLQKSSIDELHGIFIKIHYSTADCEHNNDLGGGSDDERDGDDDPAG